MPKKRNNHSSSLESGPAVASQTYNPIVVTKSPTSDITSPAGPGEKSNLPMAYAIPRITNPVMITMIDVPSGSFHKSRVGTT